MKIALIYETLGGIVPLESVSFILIYCLGTIRGLWKYITPPARNNIQK